MYSSFNSQAIKVTDQAKLKEVLNNPDLELDNLINNDLEVIFGAWSGFKLYGYFYESTMAVLTELAKCVEGWVEFTYEEGFPFRIYFDKGECYLKVAKNLNWETIPKQNFV